MTEPEQERTRGGRAEARRRAPRPRALRRTAVDGAAEPEGEREAVFELDDVDVSLRRQARRARHQRSTSA